MGLFVTDNERAFVSSIEEAFPESRHILCAWHISQHLRSNMAGCFREKSKEIGELRDCIHEMVYHRDVEVFKTAVQKYYQLAKKGSVSFARENGRKSEKKGRNVEADLTNKKTTRKSEEKIYQTVDNKKESKIIEYFEGYVRKKSQLSLLVLRSHGIITCHIRRNGLVVMQGICSVLACVPLRV